MNISEQTIEAHQALVINRVKDVLKEHAPDLFLAFVGAGIVEQLQSLPPATQPALEIPLAPVLEAKNDEETIPVEVAKSVTVEDPVEVVDAPIMLEVVELDEVPAPIEAFIKNTVEGPLAASPPAPLVEPKVETPPPIKPTATVNQATFEILFKNADCSVVETKYDPTNLQQAVQWCYDDKDVTREQIARLMIMPKAADANGVVRYARYHAEQLRLLRPFERDEYKRMLRVRLLERHKEGRRAN